MNPTAFDIVPASPEALAELEAFVRNWYSMKFAMNSLLLKRRLSAGKNASLVFSELSPFSSSVSLFSLLASESVLGNRSGKKMRGNEKRRRRAAMTGNPIHQAPTQRGSFSLKSTS